MSLDLSYQPDIFKVQKTSSPFIEHSYFLACCQVLLSFPPLFPLCSLTRAYIALTIM